MIDGEEDSLSAGRVCEADLVFLAAPVGAIIEFLRTRGSLLKAGTIITDSGSTKREICRAAREALPLQLSFVGGHPMAGSHNAGVDYASADLFSGAPYVLVVDDTNAGSINAARTLAEIVGDLQRQTSDVERAGARSCDSPVEPRTPVAGNGAGVRSRRKRSLDWPAADLPR